MYIISLIANLLEILLWIGVEVAFFLFIEVVPTATTTFILSKTQYLTTITLVNMEELFTLVTMLIAITTHRSSPIQLLPTTLVAMKVELSKLLCMKISVSLPTTPIECVITLILSLF